MGFYFKLAPGVKIRATRRGLRASVGPRAARVHFGAGGTGVSTGAGPVSLYHSVGGGRGRRRGTGPSRTSIAAYERQLRQAQKLEQAQELQAAFEGILNLHREDWPASARRRQPAGRLTLRRQEYGGSMQSYNATLMSSGMGCLPTIPTLSSPLSPKPLKTMRRPRQWRVCMTARYR